MPGSPDLVYVSAMALNGKLALVTGGSSGIGAACATALAAEGAGVVAAARRFAPGALHVPLPGTITEAQLDVTDEDAVRARFAELPALDVLVCSAGVGTFASIATSAVADLRAMLEVHITGTLLCAREALRRMLPRQAGHIIVIGSHVVHRTFAPFRDVSATELRAMLEVHIVGTLLCAREALRRMLPRKAGHIVVIGSHAALRAFSDCSAYTAAKAGQLGLVRVLAEEARPHGIRVTNLMPGATDTPIWDDRPGFDRGKMMRPEDVASFLVAIVSRPGIAVEEVIVTPPAGAL